MDLENDSQPSKVLTKRGAKTIPKTPFKPPRSNICSVSSTDSLDESMEDSEPTLISAVDVEESVRDQIQQWLDLHGGSLFALETSKYLARLNKKK